MFDRNYPLGATNHKAAEDKCAAMQNSACATQARQPQIVEQMERLQSIIGSVNGELNEMDMKLAPVTRKVPTPESAGKDSEIRAAMCPMAETLSEMVEQLQSIHYRVMNMTHSLEL